MRAALILALVLASLALAAGAGAARNPFLSAPSKSESAAQAADRAEDTSVRRSPSPLSRLLQLSSAVQRELRSAMVAAGARIRTAPWGAAFWTFIALSFAYGVLHALGPGHGKTLSVTYFAGRPGSLAAGLAFGYLTMFTHVLSASVLVLAGAKLLGMAGGPAVERGGLLLARVSYGLITAVGLGMLAKGVFDALRPASRGHAHPLPAPRGSDRTALALTAMAAGLVPCPGAALILLFAVSHQLMRTGILAMVAVSIGMGLTISAFSLLAIGSRKALLRQIEHHDKAFRAIHTTLTLSGALAVTVVGALLLASAV